jgi:uncharacterized protein
VRVVLDTNVLVSAYAARGLCEAVVEMCLASHEIHLSEHILTELQRHLESKLKMPSEQAGEIASFLRQEATIVVPSPVPQDACRDRDDLAVLGTALSAGADVLVTGDADLLSLRKLRDIPILSPRDFHDWSR